MSINQNVSGYLNDLAGRAPVGIAMGCLICALGTPPAIQAADAPASFWDDFESADTEAWDYTGLWGNSSDVSVIYEGGNFGYVVSATAEGADWRVGKAYLTKNVQEAYRGDRIEASMRVYIPYQAPSDGSVYLMDLECRDCGYAAKPGLRVLIDSDGILRVNRSKLGGLEDFRAISANPIPFDRPFMLTLIVDLGGEDEGQTWVYIDQELVIDAVGVNMPLNSVSQPLGVTLTAERFDYLQFGVTANSRAESVNLYFDDVEIDVFSGL